MIKDVEDFAYGFREDQVKLFAFGQGHKNLFTLQSEFLDEESEYSEDLDNLDDEEDDSHIGRKVNRNVEREIIVVSRPTVIRFPKHTRPIV